MSVPDTEERSRLPLLSFLLPVFVSELNPYGADPFYALWPEPEGASGHRLQAFVLGIQSVDYVRCGRMNLCTRRWSIRNARKRADELQAETPATLILLGSKVAHAFGYQPSPTFTKIGRLVFLPHPSGLCRVWHEPGAVKRARTIVRYACPEWADLVGLEKIA